jgi:hypothetical protein
MPDFMKIYQAVSKVSSGGDTQTNSETDWYFDKPTFIFGK